MLIMLQKGRIEGGNRKSWRIWMGILCHVSTSEGWILRLALNDLVCVKMTRSCSIDLEPAWYLTHYGKII